MLANESKSSIESKLAVRNSKTPLLGTAKTVSVANWNTSWGSTSNTAFPTAEATGFPPNVLKWTAWAKLWAISEEEEEITNEFWGYRAFKLSHEGEKDPPFTLSDGN